MAFRYRDAIVTTEDGTSLRIRYYRGVRLSGPALEADICLYCGADNGPNGERRIGADDCYYCGGN